MDENPMSIRCRRIRPELDSDIPLPRYMTSSAAGMDICAAVEEPVVLEPGEKAGGGDDKKGRGGGKPGGHNRNKDSRGPKNNRPQRSGGAS